MLQEPLEHRALLFKYEKPRIQFRKHPHDFDHKTDEAHDRRGCRHDLGKFVWAQAKMCL